MKREKTCIALIVAGTVMATEKISNVSYWSGSPMLTIVLQFLIPLVLILTGTALCVNDFRSKEMRFGNSNSKTLWVCYIAAFTGILTVVYTWTPTIVFILSGSTTLESFFAEFTTPYYKPYRFIMYTTVLATSIAIIGYCWHKLRDRNTLLRSMVISSAVFFICIFVLKELYAFSLFKSVVIYSVAAATPLIISIIIYKRFVMQEKSENGISILYLLDISVMAAGLKLLTEYLKLFCLLAIRDPYTSFASTIHVRSIFIAALGITLFLYGMNDNNKKPMRTDG